MVCGPGQVAVILTATPSATRTRPPRTTARRRRPLTTRADGPCYRPRAGKTSRSSRRTAAETRRGAPPSARSRLALRAFAFFLLLTLQQPVQRVLRVQRTVRPLPDAFASPNLLQHVTCGLQLAPLLPVVSVLGHAAPWSSSARSRAAESEKARNARADIQAEGRLPRRSAASSCRPLAMTPSTDIASHREKLGSVGGVITPPSGPYRSTTLLPPWSSATAIMLHLVPF